MAGVASGLAGGTNFIITAVASYSIVGFLHPQTQSTLGWGYLITGVVSFFVLQFLLPRYMARQ
jgi:hypothetical protein